MPNNLFRGKPVKSIDLDTLPEYADWVKDGWVYGYLIGKDVIVGEVVDFEDEYFNTEFWCRVKPESVGQAIRLNDSINSEVYEGDIIRRQNMVWLVEPISSLEKDGRNWGLCVSLNGNGRCYFIDSSILKGEVIGNITDNPELLETNLE